jgi:FkbM family methyltransferase
MGNITNNIYSSFVNLAYLKKTSYSSIKKRSILRHFLLMNLKILLMGQNKPGEDRFLGLRFSFFNRGISKFLFEEVFYRSEYFFVSKNNSPVIVDCGANIGMSVLFFKWLYPESKIIAFEPDPKTFEKLEENVRINHFNEVILENSAVSNKNGHQFFYVDPKNSGSLAMSLNRDRLAEGAGKVQVKVFNLSDLVKKTKVDFLKLDVEGEELKIIRDFDKKKLFKNIGEMAIEYHHNIPNNPSSLGEFIKILEKNGYRIQIDATNIPIYKKNKYQDIIIRAYRNGEN